MKLTVWKSRLVTCVLMLVTAGGVIAQHNSINTSRSKLWKPDRERLAQAIANGQREVRLLIAAVPGTNREVARSVRKLDGAVEFEAEEIDYIRARVRFEVVEKIAAFPTVQAVAVDGPALYTIPTIPVERSSSLKWEEKEFTTTPRPAGPDTPAENPYVATRDIGAPQFIARHPTFDGRGVTIGIVESLPDVLLPELQVGKRLDGVDQPKIAAVADVLRQDDEVYGPLSIKTREVRIDNGQFIDAGFTYFAPTDGSYRFGYFESQTLSKVAEGGKWRNVSWFKTTDGKPRPIAVLWHEESGRVWVDTNQNRDFRDERELRDYNVRNDIGIFGSDDATTPWRESLGFIVLTDAREHIVRLELGTSGHTTATAFVAAGKGLLGHIDGVAPAARLFPVIGYNRQYALIEGTLLLMRNPETDVIWSAILLLQNLSETESVLPLMWSRMVAHYEKPIFVGAGNSGSGSGTLGMPSAPNLVNVGAYINKDTWWSNLGMLTAQNDYIANLSSRGPAANGALKPDLLTPICQVTPHEVYYPYRISPGGYRLPPGFYLACGTSAAGPTAAGAAALLISAAKQSGVKYDAQRLSWALKGSARYLKGWGAHEQGAGLINVAAAWELLKRGPEPITITSRGPVRTVYSRYLARANEGPGIYEREGWQAGRVSERVLTFTRKSGASGRQSYRLQWQGNDGTFSSTLIKIALPLGQDVVLPVRINPRTSGIHSASLALIDESTGIPAYKVMTTVVVAEQFNAGSGFRLEHTATVEPLTSSSWFIHVPEGVNELKLESPNVTGEVTIRAMPPWGAPQVLLAQPDGQWQSAIEKPTAGVWEIIVEQKNREAVRDEKGEIKRVIDGNSLLDTRMEAQSTVSIELIASLIGIQQLASPSSEASGAHAAAAQNRFTLVNQYGELKGAETRAALGIMRTETVTVSTGQLPAKREINVAPNTTSLLVSIREARPRTADVDLYLYDCTDEKRGCELRKSSTGAGADEELRIDQPAAGKWVVIIDPYHLPNGIATLSYSEVMTNPRFGTADVTSAPTTLAPGQRWQVNATTSVKDLPTEHARLCLVITVFDQATFDHQKSHLYSAAKIPAVLTTMVSPLSAQ